MSDISQHQILRRLKTSSCKQPNCLSNNEDNIQLIAFDAPLSLRTGLMCSSCLIDSQLLHNLQPIEHHVLPIRKFINILSDCQSKYLKLKDSQEWVPNIVGKVSKEVQAQVKQFTSQNVSRAFQVINFVQSQTNRVKLLLLALFKNSDFDKINNYLVETNETEQMKMNLSAELKRAGMSLHLIEGKPVLSYQSQINQKAQRIVQQYKNKMRLCMDTLIRLKQIQKKCIDAIAQ